MNGWFPRLNLAGEVVSGMGEVWYAGRVLLRPGYGPLWRDADRIVCGGEHDWLYQVHLKTGAVEVLTDAIPFGTYGAGGGRWKVAERIDAETREIGVTFDPVSGQCVRLLEHGDRNEDHSIIAEGTPVVEHRNVTDVRAFDGMIVWVEFTGADPTDRGVKGIDRTLTVRDLRVTPPGTWQGHPIPVRVRGEAWLVFATNLDIRLHPWGSTQGYVIRTGENRNFNHDAVAVGNAIRVAWQDSTPSGNLQVQDFPLDAPRVDVSFGLQPTPSPEPDPQPEPEPEPEPMPEIPAALRDQRELVARIRREVFPDRYQPGHPDTNEAGWLPLNAGSYSVPPERVAYMQRRIAWELRAYGVGTVKAKAGSANNYDGIVGDIVALPSGIHWDTAGDGGGWHTPAWGLVEGQDNWDAVRPRYLAPFDPGGSPVPNPDPQPDPELARLKARVAELEREVSDLRRQLAEASSKPRLSYEAMMRLVDKAEAAYVEGDWGRQPKVTIPCATWAHMLWRFMFENYTEAQLVEEARLRGTGQVPD